MLQLSDLALALGWFFWGGFFLVQVVVLSRIKGAVGRFIGFLVVSAMFFGPMVPGWIKKRDFQDRQAQARAVFDERCKTAGEKIYKVVEQTDGVLLPKIRQRTGSASDPMTPEAAAWSENYDKGYIQDFLMFAEPNSRNRYGKSIVQTKTRFPGFDYVEVLNAASGTRSRYTWNPERFLREELSPSERAPRYAVDFEDLVDPSDRQHWVAGSKIKVVDTTDQSVMAELTYFMFDPGLGSRSGQRDPWAFAVGCPNYPFVARMHRHLADKALRSAQKVEK